MTTTTVFSGIVKQVLSGDSIVIRDRPVDGPPPERTIVLSNLTCGRLARRPTLANPNAGVEDPFAWQAREFVRAKTVGKEVCYTIETELPSGRKYGTVYLGKSTSGENVALSLIQEGLAELRKLNAAVAEKDPNYQQLLIAQEQAKSLEKGRWGTSSDGTREVVWTIDDAREFLEKSKGRRIQAVVEYVRDGSTMQVTLLPEDPNGLFRNVMLSLSGVKCPTIRFEDGEQVAEPFGLDAQFFVESRLLQRDVVVLLESTMNQNFIGSVLHPKGNIAELLVREGLAKCIDWNLSLVSVPGAAEAYKTAERSAKENHLRLWKEYQVPVAPIGTPGVHDPNQINPGMSFTGKIVEVGNGDNISVKCTDRKIRKFFLSSIRIPRPAAAAKEDGSSQQRNRIRPLYDIPYVFEAREKLRLFIGKTVTVTVDYVQPKTGNLLDDRVCATIKCGDVNLAEMLITKGLSTVIRYRGNNDARSAAYTDLLAADEQAQENAIGLYSKQEPPVHRVADLTGNPAKSRQFLPFLKRTPQCDAVVEFVVHASRMRVYLPRETCLITLLLGGIQCPRKGRTLADGTEEPDMPFSAEAHAYVKEMCMQRDVAVTIETMDRVGNFVGWLFMDAPSAEPDTVDLAKSTSSKKKKKVVEVSLTKPKVNLSVMLVSQGLAFVHRAPSTEASPYYNDLIRAEETAKANGSGLWSSDEFVKQWEAQMSETYDSANLNGEEISLLPGGVTTGYLDDMSMLSLNGHAGDGNEIKEAPARQAKPVQITGVSRPAGTESLRFFVQHVSDSAAIVQITQLLNQQPPPPLPNYQPRKGEICVACYNLDNCWYRARVIRKNPKAITVQFIDFGNEETIEMNDVAARLSPLPSGALMALPPHAHEYRLAFVQLPPDAADRTFAERVFAEHVEGKEVLLSVQYDMVPCATETLKPVPGVLLKVQTNTTAGSSSDTSGSVDVAESLLETGLVCIEPMRAELQKQASRSLLSTYLEAQARAKKERKNIWRYGDFRIDTNQ